jgi:hypothetical protein
MIRRVALEQGGTQEMPDKILTNLAELCEGMLNNLRAECIVF